MRNVYMENGKIQPAGVMSIMTKNTNLLHFFSNSAVSLKIDPDAEYFDAKQIKYNIFFSNISNFCKF